MEGGVVVVCFLLSMKVPGSASADQGLTKIVKRIDANTGHLLKTNGCAVQCSLLKFPWCCLHDRRTPASGTYEAGGYSGGDLPLNESSALWDSVPAFKLPWTVSLVRLPLTNRHFWKY